MMNSPIPPHKFKITKLKCAFFAYCLFFSSPSTSSYADIYQFYVRGDSCNNLDCALHQAMKDAQASHKPKNKTESINIVNTNNNENFTLPLIILEKNNSSKSTASQTIEINGHKSGSITLDGPNKYHIEFSSHGITDQKVYKKRNSPTQKSPKSYNQIIDNPVKIAIENLVFRDDKEEYINIHEIVPKNYKTRHSNNSNNHSPKASSQILLIDEDAFQKPIYKESLQSFIEENIISGPIYQDKLQELIDEGIISEAVAPADVQKLIDDGVIESSSISSVHFINKSGKKSSPHRLIYDPKRSDSSKKGTSIYIIHRSEKEDPPEDNNLNNFDGIVINQEHIEEFVYMLGYFKIILRLFPDSDKTQISLIDERLSLLIDEGNSGEMAKYLDTLVMAPIRKITKKDEIDPINIQKAKDIDQDAEDSAQSTKKIKKEKNVTKSVVNMLNKDIEDVREILVNLPTKEALATTLNLLHPAKIADVDLILCNNHSLIYSNICRHFEESKCSIQSDNSLNVWGKAFGNVQTMHTNDGITGYHDRTGGIFVGADYSPMETICLGGGFSFTTDDVKWHNTEADALLNTYYGFLYSSLNYELCFLEAIGSLSYTSIDGNRYIKATSELDRRASHENHALTFSGRLKGGFKFNLPYAIKLQAFGATDLGNVRNRSFTEHGAYSLNLHVHKRHSTHFRSEAGLQFSKQYFTNQNTCWTPTVALKWVYQNPISGNRINANFQHQPSSFSVKTRSKITNQISPVISLTANSPDGIYLSAYYEGAFGDGWNSNEFGVHLGKTY